MRPFAYERAADPAAAVQTLLRDPQARYLAGGTNLVDHMKLGVAQPARLVDVTHLAFDAVDDLGAEHGTRVGANVRNSDLAAHPLLRERHPLVAQALLAGASGQLRNLASTAGNLLQRTRCVYFQDVSTPCNKREPGSGCSARGGYTRYHAVLGASEHCIATHPSDLAVALAAVDAVVHVLGADGPRDIPLRELHRLPGEAPERDTVLAHGDLITGVTLPPLPPGARSTYRKVRDRASFAFALVSVALVADLADDGTLRDVRIAYGGLAHKPWRATIAEDLLRGGPPSEAALRAAADAELATAEASAENAFKIPLAAGTLVAAFRDVLGELPA